MRPTTAARRRQAKPDLNKTRAAFMQRASVPNINPFALKLAYLLAFKYMNRETGTARPAQETLACDLNVTSRTVRTLLYILQPLGLVIVPGTAQIGRAPTGSIPKRRHPCRL